jgi:hypothetical protein
MMGKSINYAGHEAMDLVEFADHEPATLLVV